MYAVLRLVLIRLLEYYILIRLLKYCMSNASRGALTLAGGPLNVLTGQLVLCSGGVVYAAVWLELHTAVAS